MTDHVMNIKDALQVTMVPVTEAKREEAEAVIQAWRVQRAHRLELNRVMEEAKKEEGRLANWLLEVFKQQKFEGMIIGGRITGLSSKEIATVEDKAVFLDYIRKTGELELLQFRLATGAIDERRENGVDVPGTRYVDTYELFDRKVK